MTNFSEMRENMILGQFLPGLIKDETLINIFSAMPREEFLEEQYKQLAYSDSNINIKKNRSLMSPFSAAKNGFLGYLFERKDICCNAISG